MVRHIFGMICIAAASAAALAQPGEVPHRLEVVTTDGARHQVRAGVREWALLATEAQMRGFARPRLNIRMICDPECPASLPARRPAQDVVHWRDGRRTSGTAFVFWDVIEQNGRRAGEFGDVRMIELGTARVSAQAARGLDPIVVSTLWDQPWRSGGRGVFRRPWVTLSASTLTLNGGSPVPRGGNLRFLLFHTADHYPNTRGPWAQADTVMWRDGARTTGAVNILNGLVRQEGSQPRTLRDVAYIELARQTPR